MNLLNLTNQEFELSLVRAVGQERKSLHLVLEHIREASTRKFYLEKGRCSLHDYLTKDLGYSSSSAQRRIEGARLLKEIPEISSRIQNGKLNLSQICEIARGVTEKISVDEKLELIAAIESKTTSETQLIVAQSLDLPVQVPEFKRVQRDESVRIELTLTKEQYEKLQACRDLASHTLLKLKKSGLNLSAVIEFLCDQYIDASPSTLAKTKSDTNAASVIRRVKPSKQAPRSTLPRKHRKSITPKVRREINQKFKVCQHKYPGTQNLCGSSFLLQVDHIQSRWAGGSHEDENLTLLCANHNQLKYRQEANILLAKIRTEEK